MSVRAYKIKEIKTEKKPTFNCWSDDEVFNLANEREYDDGGTLYYDRDIVEDAIKDLEDTNRKEKTAYKILKQILADMGDDDEVSYYCY